MYVCKLLLEGKGRQVVGETKAVGWRGYYCSCGAEEGPKRLVDGSAGKKGELNARRTKEKG